MVSFTELQLLAFASFCVIVILIGVIVISIRTSDTNRRVKDIEEFFQMTDKEGSDEPHRRT